MSKLENFHFWVNYPGALSREVFAFPFILMSASWLAQEPSEVCEWMLSSLHIGAQFQEHFSCD